MRQTRTCKAQTVFLTEAVDVSHLPVHRVGEENAVLFSRVDLLRDGGNRFR